MIPTAFLPLSLLNCSVFQPSHIPDMESDTEDEDGVSPRPALVSTKLYEWFCSYFAQSVMKVCH